MLDDYDEPTVKQVVARVGVVLLVLAAALIVLFAFGYVPMETMP